MHQHAADNAAGSAASDAAAAAPPSSAEHDAQKQYQQLQDMCQNVQQIIKEVNLYCLTQRGEGHISTNTGDVNMTQGKLCDDPSALDCLVKPLLREFIKGQHIDQVTAIEFLRNASGMRQNAMLKFTQLKTLINLKLNIKQKSQKKEGTEES